MNRSREVLQAAVRLFAERGYAATGIRDLGRAAGMNSATLYHYASGKEELLERVMRECTAELLAGAQRACASSDDPSVRLARLIQAHVGLSAVNPLTARVTDHELRSLSSVSRAQMQARRDEYEHVVDDVLRRGVDVGVFNLADRDITRLALMEMCNGVANWYRPDGRLRVDALQDRFVEIALRTVGAAPVEVEDLGAREAPRRLPSEPDTRDEHQQETA